MRSISRRRLLTAGIGLPAGAAVAAAAAYGLMEEGVLPGKYRLAELLGACGAPPGPPRGPLPARREETFWSAYRHRDARMVTLIPAQQAASLGVVIALHGLGGSARAAADLYGPAMAAAGISTFAVITMDGGSTYWHQRSTGDDPLGMIIHEVLPRAAARGLATARIGIAGYSMGGYGALLLAESLGAAGPAAAVAAAVAAASPAIFASYQDAHAADPGAFDSQANFTRNDVFSRLAALRQVPVWIDCGTSDPFLAVTQLLQARLRRLTGHEPSGGLDAGCHDATFWARGAPAELHFLGQHLA
jgi:S-formylglutathione hydrolase FrmB